MNRDIEFDRKISFIAKSMFLPIKQIINERKEQEQRENQ